jgi:RND superfamily putative drug exporter
MATILGLGVGIDYSLFIVNRFREELHRRDGNVEESIAATVGSAGRAIFFSGLTVIIGMASLMLFQFMALRSQGIGGLLVVLMSMLASLTMLPAVLSLIGKWIDRWRVPFLKPTRDKLEMQDSGNGFWHKLAEFVMRHPIKILVVVLALLTLVGSPFFRVRFGEPSAEILPEDNFARVADNILRQKFPDAGKNSDVYILVEPRSGKMTDPQNVQALANYTAQLTANPVVKGIISPVNLPLPQPITTAQYTLLIQTFATDPAKIQPELVAALKGYIDGQKALIKLDTTIEYSSDAARKYIESLRAQRPAEFITWVSGEQAALIDFVDELYKDFPVAILLVVIISYLTLLILFKSVLLPLKAIIMTSLSLAASYGALVWIFQDGNLSDLLNFKSFGFVEATLPVMMFGVLFGLSMDYEVFLLTRVKEVWDETGNNTKSVALGLERTGGIITSAALIMIIVAGSFGTADIIIVKAIGIGMALAVFFDATIVRALLVPATMKLLGNWNWWLPKPLARVLPDVKVEH